MKTSMTKTTTTKVTRKASFSAGDFVGIQGWHPYCVAFIESVSKRTAVVEHEGMYFSVPTSQLLQVKPM